MHVWLFDENAITTLLEAWNQFDLSVKTNTVLVLTLAKNSNEIFTNIKKNKKKNNLPLIQ